MQLLGKLQQADGDGVWADDPDLLLWLLYTGGAYLPAGPTRSSYVAFLKRKYPYKPGDSHSLLPGVVQVLRQFIWSEEAFSRQIQNLWAETYT